MPEENPKNQLVGCCGTLVVVVSLILTISVVHHLHGFWYCTGAFLVFFISGVIGGILGAGIGASIANAQAEGDPLKQIGFAVVGAFIGDIALCIGAGKLIYGFNALSLMTSRW